MAGLPTGTTRFQAGFLAVIVLMTGVAVFTLWTTQRTNERVDRLVSNSLERERLIGTIGKDTTLLIKAADDHIGAASDEDQRSADEALYATLEELTQTTRSYNALLPRGDNALWGKLTATSQLLVAKVATTVKYATKKEALLARRHLENEVKPIYFELEALTDALALHNKSEATRVLREVEGIRLRSSVASAATVGIALAISLVIALQMMRLLRKQASIIDAQLVELGRRNEELDAFASRVAHDLIAPLAPLKGYLTLSRRQALNPQVADMLAHAERLTQRMSDLVEALLQFCRAGHQTEPAMGVLDTAATTILLEAQQTAQQSGVTLERNLQSDVQVDCPQQLLQSICQNVISNAVKYSALKPGASVKVVVRREGDQAVLDVVDNGPGISAESLKRLYTPFFRTPEAARVPGHGLGLATTRRLVEAHKGSLELTSTPGEGTRVRVSFPLWVAHAPRQEASA